jgi:hypothetical protein
VNNKAAKKATFANTTSVDILNTGHPKKGEHSTMTYPFSRRTVVKGLMLGSAGTLLIARRSAAEPAKLSVTDPAAVALGYVENASQVDTKKYPSYVKGSTCENCLQLQGKSGDAFRPCSLFKDKLVAAGGWCSGWTAEM